MLHLPVLRAGEPYRSLDVVTLTHLATGEPVAEVSQANRGLISRDLIEAGEHRDLLRGMPTAKLIEICREAGRLFVEGELAIGLDGEGQGPDDYVRCQSATTGMPEALCRLNMEKIRYVLEHMDQVLGGLTRGLDLETLDRGYSSRDGRVVSYRSEATSLGAVLPSNSPGVHSLWLPALALKVPVVLKPGREEPWTPARVAAAFIAAGLPKQALSLYPTDHSGANEILLRCSRSMFFGDASTVQGWADDPRVQLHGPGWSKVIFGEDAVDRWADHLDLLATSVAENGGRSCLNASGVWAPSHGRAIAAALAEKLAGVEARGMTDPEARLCAFVKPEIAHRVSDYIDTLLKTEGAEDLSAAHRPKRVVEADGCTFLLPTVIWCEDSSHPLASCEFLFPFVSVCEAPQGEVLDRIGPTLVVTALTDDPELKLRLMHSGNVDRLNLGSFPTSRVSWDQPHEGNLFEHLYRQRAFQLAEVG